MNQPLGALSDKYGRKPLLLFLSALTAVVRGYTAASGGTWFAVVLDRIIGDLTAEGFQTILKVNT